MTTENIIPQNNYAFANFIMAVPDRKQYIRNIIPQH